MATKPVTAKPVTPHPATQQLPLVPNGGLVSPYDGTTPFATPGGYPLETGAMPGSLAGLGAAKPQVNATNQSALAPNGDINQTVTNENRYENKYYNIITTPYGYGPGYGAGYGAYSLGGTSGLQAWVDPVTGAVVYNQERGLMGWLKRLFRGY